MYSTIFIFCLYWDKGNDKNNKNDCNFSWIPYQFLTIEKNTMFVGRTKLNVLSAGMSVESSIGNLLSLLGMLYR